ncbi:hypothetical protein [Streptomyces sp. SudanB52_2052]|uniref:hypothetical protein n=1 Tax=Streptomyces sp. SudanB52_2052 TaxID=3035276 RepID=UPI003F54934E
MNELEIAQFAVPAAQALLTVMVSDGWQSFKGRLARIVGGSLEDPHAAEEHLDEMRLRLISDDSQETLQQKHAEMVALLCAAITKDPNTIAPLKELLGDVQASNATVNAEQISQNATVRDNAVNFQQISGTQNYRAD